MAAINTDTTPVKRNRSKPDLACDIERKLGDHEVGKLLTTIDGSRR
jgi:hypothetical protein